MARQCANGDPFGLEGFRFSLRSQPGFLSQRPCGVRVCVCVRVSARGSSGVCVRPCEQEGRSPGMWKGAARGVAFSGGNGGGLLCVGLGGWAALRPTSGRERVPGRRGPGKKDGMGILFLPGFLPQAFLLEPGFRRVHRTLGAAAAEAAFPEWKVL